MQVLFCKSIEVVGLELRLKALRRGLNKKDFPTYESFYDHFEVNRTNWWRWEQGKRAIPYEVIQKLEVHFEIDLQVPTP
ncbi:MAG: helix-turn-helix domain-containing protein [Tildeniella torsiva UHER 1998/13D]|jgi:hypothetical protein|nr:helix-turn-helix domain-containing protein [Tildeniella torsiva UHER 1998/13D]